MNAEDPRPGGMRDGRILRFAEADTDSARISAWCSNTAEPERGLPLSLAPRIPPGREEGKGEVEDRGGMRDEKVFLKKRRAFI